MFVQNLLECATNGTYQFFVISGESATNALLNNIIIWHNDVLGKGCDLAYNNNGTSSVQRLLWSVKNNLLDKLDIKSDTGTDSNGNRTGDWSELFGVSYSGNFNANTTGIGSTEDFNPDYLGLCSYQPTNLTGASSGFFQFIDRETFNGTLRLARGHGNYKLQSGSPVLGLTNEWLLPFDLEGNPRSMGNVAGVFAAGMSSPALPFLVADPVPTTGQFQLDISNLAGGTSYVLEATSDFVTWTPLATNIATEASSIFIDTNAVNFGWRFYRLVVQGAP